MSVSMNALNLTMIPSQWNSTDMTSACQSNVREIESTNTTDNLQIMLINKSTSNRQTDKMRVLSSTVKKEKGTIMNNV